MIRVRLHLAVETDDTPEIERDPSSRPRRRQDRREQCDSLENPHAVEPISGGRQPMRTLLAVDPYCVQRFPSNGPLGSTTRKTDKGDRDEDLLAADARQPSSDVQHVAGRRTAARVANAGPGRSMPVGSVSRARHAPRRTPTR